MLTKIMFVIITYLVSSMNKNQNRTINLRMFIYNLRMVIYNLYVYILIFNILHNCVSIGSFQIFLDFQYAFVWNYQIKILIFQFLKFFFMKEKSFVVI